MPPGPQPRRSGMGRNPPGENRISRQNHSFVASKNLVNKSWMEAHEARFSICKTSRLKKSVSRATRCFSLYTASTTQIFSVENFFAFFKQIFNKRNKNIIVGKNYTFLRIHYVPSKTFLRKILKSLICIPIFLRNNKNYIWHIFCSKLKYIT